MKVHTPDAQFLLSIAATVEKTSLAEEVKDLQVSLRKARAKERLLLSERNSMKSLSRDKSPRTDVAQETREEIETLQRDLGEAKEAIDGLEEKVTKLSRENRVSFAHRKYIVECRVLTEYSAASIYPINTSDNSIGVSSGGRKTTRTKGSSRSGGLETGGTEAKTGRTSEEANSMHLQSIVFGPNRSSVVFFCSVFLCLLRLGDEAMLIH